MPYEPGDRVKVVRVIAPEPCYDFSVLIGEVGTVIGPVEDEDLAGNPVTNVEVTLDHPADLGGRPAHLATRFVFTPAELTAEQD